MQTPTHILVGIGLYELTRWLLPNLPYWGIVLIVIPLAVGSHVLLDSFNKLTYHLPEAQWKDPFWVSYHVIFVYIGALIAVIVFFIPYWWVIIAANLPDIVDWLILRLIAKKPPVFHPLIDRFRNKFFGYLPDLTAKKWTVCFELSLVVILILVLFF